MKKFKGNDKMMTDKQRQSAINAVKRGVSPRKLAIKYNVSTQHIYFICKPEAEQREIVKKRLLKRKLKSV